MPAALMTERTYTPEEVDEWDNGVAFELDDEGRLIERNMGFESDEIASEIIITIGIHVRANRLGRVSGGGTGLRIFPGRPRRMPRADVVFISNARLSRSPRGLLEVPPDLLVEVVSPGDKAGDIQSKAIEYLDGGVEIVWVVFPDTRRIHVYRRGQRLRELGPEDTITGEDVLPGFEAKVASFFPERSEPED